MLRRSAIWAFWGRANVQPIFPRPCRPNTVTTLESRSFTRISAPASAEGPLPYNQTHQPMPAPLLAADARLSPPPSAEHPWMQFSNSGGARGFLGGQGPALPFFFFLRAVGPHEVAAPLCLGPLPALTVPRPGPRWESLAVIQRSLEGRLRFAAAFDFQRKHPSPQSAGVGGDRAIPPITTPSTPNTTRLREAGAGQPWDCRPSALGHIGLFNGVDAAIHCSSFLPRSWGNVLLTTSPTSATTSPCAQMAGMAIRGVPYTGTDFSFPLGAIPHPLFSGPARGLLLLC